MTFLLVYCVPFLQISVCEMIETRSGFRQKSKSTVLEMNQAKRSDDYATFAVKAASALSLEIPPKSVLRIFKVSGGAVIQNEDITIHGEQRNWTLGNYLALLKKSPSAVKIGVGYIHDETQSDSGREGSSSHKSVSTVRECV